MRSERTPRLKDNYLTGSQQHGEAFRSEVRDEEAHPDHLQSGMRTCSMLPPDPECGTEHTLAERIL